MMQTAGSINGFCSLVYRLDIRPAEPDILETRFHFHQSVQNYRFDVSIMAV